jgi:capsular polysaccharide transport system ATP-binding protein
MILLEAVSKTEGARTVLREVSALMPTGQSIGILGGERSGKSTLLRLIAGLERPSRGRVTRRARTSWPLGEPMRLETRLSAADNVRVLARIHGASPAKTLDAVEAFAQFGPRLTMPFGSFSRRERNLLLTGLWLTLDFDCYLIDDFTQNESVFRRDFRKVFDQRCRRGWVVAASKSPGELKRFCTMGAVLSGGRLSLYETFTAAVASYEAIQARRA